MPKKWNKKREKTSKTYRTAPHSGYLTNAEFGADQYHSLNIRIRLNNSNQGKMNFKKWMNTNEIWFSPWSWWKNISRRSWAVRQWFWGSGAWPVGRSTASARAPSVVDWLWKSARAICATPCASSPRPARWARTVPARIRACISHKITKSIQLLDDPKNTNPSGLFGYFLSPLANWNITNQRKKK